MTNAVLIASKDFGAKQLYIITSTRFLANAYVWIIWRDPVGNPRKTGHFTAYLNVEKEKWVKIGDSSIAPFEVTFEGVPSLEFAIPVDLTRHIPVTLYDYWIGRDWMNWAGGQINHDKVLEQMLNLFDSYLEATGTANA